MPDATNFCCRAGGNNLNAGTVDGSATEPAVTPLATYTNGNWNSSTGVFLATAGADMTAAVVGRFASICLDADAVPTTNQWMVARITAVNAGTRSITVSGSARALLGTVVATGTTGRTLRVGGAWLGPGGAAPFPITIAHILPTNVAGDPARLHLKADQVYNVTASLTTSVAVGGLTLHGYAGTYGDGGRATVDGGGGTSYGLFRPANGGGVWLDSLVFDRNGASGTATTGVLGNGSTTALLMTRCVVRNMWGSGVGGSGTLQLVECEVHGNNLSNTSGNAGVIVSSTTAILRCVVHHNAGSQTRGIHASNGALSVVDCVVHANGMDGISQAASTSLVVARCDVHANGRDGIEVGAGGTARAWIDSCNLLANARYGVEGVTGPVSRCGFGRGTMANALGDFGGARHTEVGSVTYPADTTPWADPANGDFSIALAEAQGAGHGTFLQTAAGYAGTLGFPDIGAAQSLGAAATAEVHDLTDFAETALLAGTPHPTTLWVKLHVGDPTEAGTASPAAHVARVPFTRTTPAAGTCANAGAVTFTGLAASETISHISLWDDDTSPEGPGLRLVESGAPWWYGPLAEPVPVTLGMGFTIPAGELVLALD